MYHLQLLRSTISISLGYIISYQVCIHFSGPESTYLLSKQVHAQILCSKNLHVFLNSTLKPSVQEKCPINEQLSSVPSCSWHVYWRQCKETKTEYLNILIYVNKKLEVKQNYRWKWKMKLIVEIGNAWTSRKGRNYFKYWRVTWSLLMYLCYWNWLSGINLLLNQAVCY